MQNKEGHIVKGKKHSECDEKGNCGETYTIEGTNIKKELEEGEAVIIPEAFDVYCFADSYCKKPVNYKITGTIKQIASAINMLGNGANFAPGAKVYKNGRRVKPKLTTVMARRNPKTIKSGSVVINRTNMNNPQILTFEGTTYEIANAINTYEGNGRSLKDIDLVTSKKSNNSNLLSDFFAKKLWVVTDGNDFGVIIPAENFDEAIEKANKEFWKPLSSNKQPKKLDIAFIYDKNDKIFLLGKKFEKVVYKTSNGGATNYNVPYNEPLTESQVKFLNSNKLPILRIEFFNKKSGKIYNKGGTIDNEDIVNKLSIGQALIYKGKTVYVSKKSDKIGVSDLSRGAGGLSNSFFIPKNWSNYTTISGHKISESPEFVETETKSIPLGKPEMDEILIHFENHNLLKLIPINTGVVNIAKYLNKQYPEWKQFELNGETYRKELYERLKEGGLISSDKISIIDFDGSKMYVINDWNSIPEVYKKTKKLSQLKFKEDPTDKNFISIFSPFLNQDKFRPSMNGVNFSMDGIVATDAHKLLHIPRSLDNSISGTKDIGKSKYVDSKEIESSKFPNWKPVIPSKDIIVSELKISVEKFYTYLQAISNFTNNYTNQCVFKLKEYDVAFNVKFLIQTIESLLKIKSVDILYFNFSDNASKPLIISTTPSFSIKDDVYALIMPVALPKNIKSNYKYGAYNSEKGIGASCYYDFNKDEIINHDNLKANFSELKPGDITISPQIISTLTKFNRYNTLPILDNILVTKDYLVSTNLESFVLLNNNFKLNEGIYINNNKALLPNVNEEIKNFPPVPKLTDERISIKLNSKIFLNALKICNIHISNDDLRPVLSGICIEYKNEVLSLTSTDAHTLSHINITEALKGKVQKEFQVILTGTKYLEHLMSTIDVEEIIFSENYHKYKIKSDRFEFISRLEDGKYPNYEAVVPAYLTKLSTINAIDLKKCISLNKIKSKHNITSVFDYKNSLFVREYKTNSSSDNSEPIELCELKIKTESYPLDTIYNKSYILIMPVRSELPFDTFNFNITLLERVLKTQQAEELKLYWNEPNKPYIIVIDLYKSENKNKKKETKASSDKTLYSNPVKNYLSSKKLTKSTVDNSKKITKNIKESTPEKIIEKPKVTTTKKTKITKTKLDDRPTSEKQKTSKKIETLKKTKEYSDILKDVPERNINLDLQRTALPPGKRTSKSGNVYYESRREKSDINPKKNI